MYQMNAESTTEHVLKNVPQLRILCVGHSGVGKSSLIKSICGMTEADLSRYGPVDANNEFVPVGRYFVFHDSKGFEPENGTNFDLVAQFLRNRQKEEFLKDQVHAIWLCIETPLSDTQLLRKDDEKLLALAHDLQIPLVVVCTKFDLLVAVKCAEQLVKHGFFDEEASKSFAPDMSPLDEWADDHEVPMPPYVKISVFEYYEESIAGLVDVTCRIVHERFKGDTWAVCAIAQQANLPVKIAACVNKGVDFYYCAFSGRTQLGMQNMLLRECLAQVHENIVTCWNFRDEDKILVAAEFRQLILYLIEEVHTQSPTSAPSVDRIGWINQINARTLPIAQPVAITYFFVKWFENTILDQIPEIECLLMAYIVDLTLVLKTLFDITLKPHLAGMTNLEVLNEAFEGYERSNKRKEVHMSCQLMYEGKNETSTREDLCQRLDQLLGESLGLNIHGSRAK